MISINTTWPDLKTFAVNRSVSVQWVVVNDFYFLSAIDGNYGLTCQINLDNNLPEGQTKNADVLDFETNFKANGNKTLPQQSSPFASKTLANGKKLYKREHGVQYDCVQGENIIIFTIPYNWVKIIGIEVMWGEKLDNIDLFVLDSVAGTYSTVANKVLNQFGDHVNIAIDEYEEVNSYDADLYMGMQIKLVYRSASAKTVGINFNLNEVK